MQLQWLYYFTTIAELEHYTRAAEKLRVSQSNLSHAMRDMERELGTRLFERKGRNVQLTKYGQLFLPYAKKTINTLEAGVNTLKEYLDPNKGNIILGGFYSVEAFATDLMVRYRSETNRVRVQFQYSSEGWYNLRRKLLNGELDLIISTKIDSPQVDGCWLGEHALVALVPEKHPFAARKSLRVEDFNGQNFVSFDASGEISRLVKNGFEKRGVSVNTVMESPNDVVIYGVVAAGYGLSIVPHPLTGVPFGTKIIPLEGASKRRLYLQWNKERYAVPAVEYFKNYVIRSGDVLDQYLKRMHIIPASGGTQQQEE